MSRLFILLFLLWGGALCSSGAVITVCDEASLRAAVAQGGNIVFQCDGTITLTNSLIVSSTNTTIDGAGHTVVINGGRTTRHFEVRQNASLYLKNLTLSNGFFTAWPHHINQLSIGGSVFVQGGTLRLLNCRWVGNIAEGSYTSETLYNSAFGGAIAVANGSLWVTNCQFITNQAIQAFDPNRQSRAGGGAIFLSASTAFVTNTSFSGNVVGNTANLDRPNSGGAILVLNSTLDIGSSLFSSNRSVAKNHAAQGGAVAVETGTLRLVRTSFEGNRVESSAGLAHGGAIFHAGGQFILEACDFKNNLASGQARGGAIYHLDPLQVDKSTFSGNSAVSTLGMYYGFPAYGGAIHSAAQSSQLQVVNSTFMGNLARAGDSAYQVPRGGLSLDGASASGGAIYLGGSASNLIWNVTFASNRVVGGQPHGEMYGFLPGPGLGSALYLSGGSATLNQNIFWRGLGSSNAAGLFQGSHNLSDDSTPIIAGGTNFYGEDARLGLLQFNGGYTDTMAPLPGSPTADRGVAELSPPDDQRGTLRPVGPGCDLGAVEGTTGRAYPRLSLNFSPALIDPNQTSRLTFALSNPGTGSLNNVSFALALPEFLRIAAQPMASNSCGGTFSPPAKGNLIQATGINLGPGSSCQLSLFVQASSAGRWSNEVSSISSLETGTVPAFGQTTLTARGPAIVVGAGSADLITSQSARLSGTANLLGLPSAAWFEFGSSTSYGQQTPPLNLAGAWGNSAVRGFATNLLAASLYHARLVVSNEFGVARGADFIFQTKTNGPGNTLLFTNQHHVMVLPAPGNPRNQITLEAWINPSRTNNEILSYGGGEMALLIQNGKLALRLGTVFSAVSSNTVPTNRWVHAAGSHDYSIGESRVYLDGQLEASAQTGTNTIGVNRNFYIGGYLNRFVGLMDEVRLWGVIRTPAEILNNHSIPLVGNEPGLAGYWRMDESGGETLFDSSVRGYHVPVSSFYFPRYLSTSPFDRDLRATTEAAVTAGRPDSAILYGTVSARSSGAAFFEWGPTTALGSRTPSQMVASNETLLISQALSGLSEGTTYYYRMVVTNQVEQIFGAMLSFTTSYRALNALRFDGQNDYLATEDLFNNPQTFTLSLWFRTTNAGGKLIGFGSERLGSSASFDRHLYMNNAGQLLFGVASGTSRVIATSLTYHDGQWHAVSATFSSQGMKLYLDGFLAASDATVSNAAAYSGWWRLGGDTWSDGPRPPAPFIFAATWMKFRSGTWPFPNRKSEATWWLNSTPLTRAWFPTGGLMKGLGRPPQMPRLNPTWAPWSMEPSGSLRPC